MLFGAERTALCHTETAIMVVMRRMDLRGELKHVRTAVKRQDASLDQDQLHGRMITPMRELWI